MAFTWARFKDVSAGVQAGQFSIGDREELASLDQLDPIYKQLVDGPYHANFGVLGNDGNIDRKSVV